MTIKAVDPRCRWVWHVVGTLQISDQAVMVDRCITTDFRLDHEGKFDMLRDLIIGSVNVRARSDRGAVIVGEQIPIAFVFGQTPKLVRTFLEEQQPAPGPVLVQ